MKSQGTKEASRGRLEENFKSVLQSYYFSKLYFSNLAILTMKKATKKKKQKPKAHYLPLDEMIPY